MISLLFSDFATVPVPLRCIESPAESMSVNQEPGTVKHPSSSNNNNRLHLWFLPGSWTNKPVCLGKKSHPSSREQMSQCCCFLLSSVVLIKLHLTMVRVVTRCTESKRKVICMTRINNRFTVPGILFMLIGGIILHVCIDSTDLST